METTVLNEILAFLFGRKYYANIVATRGTDRTELSAFILHDKKQVERHKMQIRSTALYEFVETISFRSRHEYKRLKQFDDREE